MPLFFGVVFEGKEMLNPNMSIRQRTLYIVFFGIPSVRVRKKPTKRENE